MNPRNTRLHQSLYLANRAVDTGLKLPFRIVRLLQGPQQTSGSLAPHIVVMRCT